MKKTLFIEGMSCNHCKMRVENTLKEFENVETAHVDLEAKTAVIEGTGDLTESALKEAIDDIGFDCLKIEG